MLGKLGNKKGFTMVEVIASFAVVAIIGGALLQMFLTSAIANRRASDVDKANTLCVEIGEQFKSVPNPASADSYDELLGLPDPDPSSPNKTYIEYIDADWNRLPDITNAKYQLTAGIVQDNAVQSVDASYLPVMAWSGTMESSSSNFFLIIQNTPDFSSVIVSLDPTADAFPINVDTTKIIDGSIPVLLKSGGNSGEINVFISCDAKYDANGDGTQEYLKPDIYIDAVNNGITNVNINPFDGSYSLVDASESNSYKYTMTLSIIRLSDGTELAGDVITRNLLRSEQKP